MDYFAIIEGDGEAGSILCKVCAADREDTPTVLLNSPDPIRACSECGLTPRDYAGTEEVMS